jgi:hypothetical protein
MPKSSPVAEHAPTKERKKARLPACLQINPYVGLHRSAVTSRTAFETTQSPARGPTLDELLL